MHRSRRKVIAIMVPKRALLWNEEMKQDSLDIVLDLLHISRSSLSDLGLLDSVAPSISTHT